MPAPYDYSSITGYARSRPDWISWPSVSTPITQGNLDQLDQAIADLKGLSFNVKDYGAKGDDTTDDTTAIQAADTAARAANGYVLFPPGTYKTTSALNPFSYSRWLGSGRSLSAIKQHTDNTPIIKFATDNTLDWAIRDLGLIYANQQTSSNTSAVAIQFYLAASSGNGFYHGSLENLYISKAYRGIATDGAAAVAYPLWQSRFKNIWMLSLSGAGVRLRTPAGTGADGNRFESISIDNIGHANSEVQFQLSAHNSVSISGLDLQGSAVFPLIYADSSDATIDGVHFENMSASAADPVLVYWANNTLRISGINMPAATTTVNPTSGKVALLHADAGATIVASGLNVGVTSTGSAVVGRIGSGGATITYLDPPQLGTNFTGLYSENYAGSAAGTITHGNNQVIDYEEFTGNVSITATVEASANTIVSSAAAFTFDGSTTVEVEFYSPGVVPGTTNTFLYLFDDVNSAGAASIGQVARVDKACPVHVVRRMKPSAGTHSLSFRGIVDAGTGTVAASTGGAGKNMPGFIKITRV